MYRRYQPAFTNTANTPPQNIAENCGRNKSAPTGGPSGRSNMPGRSACTENTPKRAQNQSKNNCGHKTAPPQDCRENKSYISPLLKFIPQSLYNPETGKVLGFMSAEDLLLAALILLLIDNRSDEADNSFLIYALIYILLSDHINLPF